MKNKSTDKRTKGAPVVDLTDEHRTKAGQVVDLTEEHFDGPMEKIRHELDRREAGMSPKKAASEDKEMIEEEMKRHERSLQYSVHRYISSDPRN